MQRTISQSTRGNTLVDLLKYVGAFYGGKGKGWFPEHRCIWAGVFSLSWIHFATKSLPIACWWCLWQGRCALVVWTNYVWLIPEMENGFLMPNKTSFLRRTGLEWLSSYLNCLHQTIAQRGWGSTCVYEPSLLENLSGKWAWVVFLSTEALGGCLFTCWTRKLPNAWG